MKNKNYKIVNGVIKIKIDDVKVGVGHITYSGYGVHSNHKLNKKIRKNNKREGKLVRFGDCE